MSMTTPPKPALELADRAALVVGGGQTPGETVGNGRATALLFGREGARVVVADRELERAEQTAAEIRDAGGQAWAVAADITDEGDVREMIRVTVEALGTINILHNNVGVSLAGGDAVIDDIDLDAFERITRINLTGMVTTCKHVLPIMRAAGGGSITSVGSLASLIDYPYIAYKTSKAGVVSLTENIAIRQAAHGIRANAILPGLMETPMAIENRIGLNGWSRDDVLEERNSHVPLRGRQGSGWDIAETAVFLNSERARFVTGVALAVDGGQTLRAG